MTVAELAQAFLASAFRRGLTPVTQEGYRYHLARLERWLESEELDLGQLSQRLADPGLALTFHQRRTASIWLNWAYREGFLVRRPVPLRQVRRTIDALTLDQVAALLETPAPAADPRVSLRDQALLETFYGTGVRLAEAAGLDRGDLDLAQGLLRVRGKAGRERLQPLGPSLKTAVLPRYLEEVRATWALPGEAALFVSCRGQRLSAEGIKQRVILRGRQAGLGAVYPHALRRAFATHLLDAGAPLEAVRALLGHQDMQVLHLYLTVSDASLEASLGRFHPRRRPPR